VLDELLRAGVVEQQDDVVRLARGGYVSDLPEDRLAFMGAHIGDHLRATVHNLEGRTPTYLEQSVYFDDLPPIVPGEVRDDLRQLGEQVLQEAYQRITRAEKMAQSAQADDLGAPQTSKKRLRLGVYYYEDDMPASNSAGGQP
jgi:hypothetical protein